MTKSSLWPTTLALLALVAMATLVALPAAAEQTPSVSTSAEASLFEPAPIEQAKPPKCAPQEEEFSTFFEPVFSSAECESTCTSYCQDNGGYALVWDFIGRGLWCNCTCCR